MRQRHLLALLLSLLIATSASAEVVIKGDVKVSRDKLVRLTGDGIPPKAGIVWKVSPSKGIDKATCTTKNKLEFVAPPGTYTVSLLAISIDKTGEVSIDDTEVTVTIGDVPPVPPDPGPGPGPNPPVPPGPAPIPVDGLRVLIVYESADLAKLSISQQAIVYGKTMRDLLNDKCVVGPDGKTREWRFWDKDVDVSAESKLWQDAMKRDRKTLPWLIISNGKAGFEGPLPGTTGEMTTLLAKYEPAKSKGVKR